MSNSTSNTVYVSGVTTNGLTTSGTVTTTAGTGTLTIATPLASFGYVPTSYTTSLPNPITYNDFWKFDEEFDILWKSFFEAGSSFKPIKDKIVSHPCDIQETDNGLKIELAAVGLEKSDIDIIIDSETLRVAYRKSDEEKKKEKQEYRYLQRSIKKASFDIAWKISSKYELANLKASLEKGLLTLDIPFAKENKPKKITIN